MKIKRYYPEQIDVTSERLNAIRNRFYLLEKKDRMIMSLYLDKDLSFRQIALLLKNSPSSISRRIRKIAFELTKGKYILCLNVRHILTRREMEIAKDYFIAGLSIKQIAEKNETSFYHIREQLNDIHHTISKTQKENQ